MNGQTIYTLYSPNFHRIIVWKYPAVEMVQLIKPKKRSLLAILLSLFLSGCVQTQADRAAIANLAIAHDPVLAPDFCKREIWGCK